MQTHSRSSHSTHTAAGFLLAVPCFILFTAAGRAALGAPPARPTLTLEERVRYQRAIEAVNCQYRIWPRENPQSKPGFEAVMSRSAIRAKVEDDLRKSKALEVYWQRPVTGAQLQAEMDRMARQTKQPERLRALWAALENDPFLIAECLAGPQLVNRLIRSWYTGDERLHGALRKRAEAEVAQYGVVKDLREMSGEYEELESVRKQDGGAAPTTGAMALDAAEWREQERAIRRVFQSAHAPKLSLERRASERRLDGENVSVGVVSHLQEREDSYYVLAVLEKEEGRMRVATVTWRKRPFEAWWGEAARGLKAEPIADNQAYRLPALPAGVSCADDTWSPTPAPSVERAGHTAVWTGTEMIVWGGNEWREIKTGGRYDLATDTWVATTLNGAPSARRYHTVVWTEMEMIVWGGWYPYTNTGGRYCAHVAHGAGPHRAH